MSYNVVLKSLRNDGKIVLCEGASKQYAEDMRKNWRKVLGGKNWIVDRRPGLDTLDTLALTIEEVKA